MSLWLGIGLGIIPTAARPGATTAPVNVVKPSFDGILTQGQSADVNPGSWTGLPSPNFTYAIKRSGVTVSTDPEYVWTAADVAAGVNAMTVDVTATNEIGPTTATSDPVTIAAPLALSGSPPVATVGASYSFTPTRTGGHAPFTFALEGVLPTGLSFDTGTGEISGTPVSSGEATLSIDVTDKDGLTASLGPFDLVVSSTAVAPAVSKVLSVVGDSWTEGNESKISRDPPNVVDSDRWDYQLAQLLGVQNYTTPGQAGVEAGVINVGYGGQTSSRVYHNLKAILEANPSRLTDAFTWWPGRNDVTKPGGDIWPSVTGGEYSVVVTANLTEGNASVTGVTPSMATIGNHNGMAVSGPGVPDGAYISGDATGTSFTLSAPATASGTGVTLTLTAKGAGDFLDLIPHDRKLAIIPYGGGSIAASQPDWVRWNRLKWFYRRHYRKHVLELLRYFTGRAPYGSDGGATDNANVSNQQLITSLTTNAHPNYLAVPLIAAAMEPVTKALQNEGVYVLEQTIPDVRRDMAAGQTLEVAFKGYVTSCEIAVDDPVHPGLFTIAMKPGSHDTGLLTRTSSSPGVIPQVLNLQVTANGFDTAGGGQTHTNHVRILPSVIGAASTLPVGARFPRDDVNTNKRWPYMMASASPFANDAKFTFVLCFKPGEDATNMNIWVAGSNVIINRASGSNGRLAIVIRDTANTIVLNWTTLATTFNVAGGETWVAFSIDLGAPAAVAYSGRPGADVNIAAASAPIAGSGLINLSSLPKILADSASTFVGGVKSLWVASGVYFDFSDPAQRRKFWNENGSPVDLGADGSVGTGVVPQVYFRGAPGDWITGKNFGSGPDFAFHDNWLSNQGQSSDPTVY